MKSLENKGLREKMELMKATNIELERRMEILKSDKHLLNFGGSEKTPISKAHTWLPQYISWITAVPSLFHSSLKAAYSIDFAEYQDIVGSSVVDYYVQISSD